MSSSTRTVERCLSIAAPRREVYQALLDPAALSRWLFAAVRIRPQKGGAYRIEWQDTSLPASAQGEILEMEEGRRLVLSWFMEQDGRDTVASFDLEDDDGRTLLRFRHAGLPGGPEWQSRYEMVSSEWDKTLENLRFLLEERRGDRPLFYQRHQVNLPATRERTHLQWMVPAALCRWLAREAFVDPAAGGEIDLLLIEGSRVRGTIRAFIPGKHLRVLWEEDGRRSLIGISFWTAPEGCVMTLTQRSFAIGDEERDRLGSVWSERFARLRTLLDREPGRWPSGGQGRIEVSRTFPVPPEEVWKACADPGFLVGWFCDRAEFTLQKGHDYSFLWTGFGEMRGGVIGFDMGKVLRFSWDLPSVEKTTEVDLQFLPFGNDRPQTRLVVTHSGWGEGEGWEAEARAHRFGWSSVLAMLDFYLRNRGRGARGSFLIRRRFSLPVERLWRHFSTAEGLATWLGTETGVEPSPGGPYRARLRDGTLLEGRVAAADPMEGIAIRIETPEPIYLEFNWAREGTGSRLLLSGLAYGAHDPWPLQQRIQWGEHLGRLADVATGKER